MLGMFFTARLTLKRLRSGPSGPYIDGFAKCLSDDGYSIWTATRYLRSAAHLGRFVESRGVTLGSTDQKLLRAYQRHLPHCRCAQSNGGRWNREVLCGAKRFVAYLREIGAVTREKESDKRKKTDPALVQSFRDWLQKHRGLADSTRRQYGEGATELLNSLGDHTTGYDARSIREFLIRSARQCGKASAQNLVTSVRMFLRYLATHGKCKAGLDQAVPTLAGWRLATLPRCLTAAEVERMLQTCDLRSIRGIRDLAILLLLSRFALRAGDVAGLRLSDIDWEDGSLVVSGKARREVRLPLSQEVGDAILKYLKCRPPIQVDRVFVRAIAPFKPFHTRAAVCSVVRRALHRAGVKAPSYGAHILRHTAATEMLRQGVPLYEIGSVLRHRSMDMTAYYAKVDVVLLQQVAQPWPEVLQ
jgi:site-specific recombinase XerD